MTDPVFSAEEVEGIVAHMNEDHGDAVMSYARAFTSRGGIRSASMLSIDIDGIDLRVEHNGGTSTERVGFDKTLQNASQARKVLVELVKKARDIEAEQSKAGR